MEFKVADQMKNTSSSPSPSSPSSKSVKLMKAKITAMGAEAIGNKLPYLSSKAIIKNEGFTKPPKRQLLLLDACRHPSSSNDQLVKSGRTAMRLGQKISETLKGKLRRIGGKISLQGGGAKAFKHNFDVREGEMMLKASQCYLSTTAGPIAGLLFISTDKIAFCSNRSVIELKSPAGKLIGIRYKVSIPVQKIKRVYESSNVKKPSEKYIQVVTEDNFEFWFMGFLNHQSMLRCLQQALL